MMQRIAVAALAALLLAPASGFSQVVLPPGQSPAMGSYGTYPTNIYPSGSYPGGNVQNGVVYNNTIPAGTLPGQVGQVPGYYPGQSGINVGNGVYNPYDDPRYSQQYGNRYWNNTFLNRGLSPAIVPALMGGLVGAVLGAHFGFKGILIGGIGGFLIGNAIWSHFTGQSVFDFLTYGPWAYPYGQPGYGYPGGGYGSGYPGQGFPPYGYPGNAFPPTGFPPYANPGFGGGYVGAGGQVFGGPGARMTVNGALLKAPAAPSSDLATLRQSYFDTVSAYQGAMKAGKSDQEVLQARQTMESARQAYQDQMAREASQ